MGRPTKLTPELQHSICLTLNMGVDIEVACQREGISRDTYYEWRQRGRAGEQPYADFLEASDIALAEIEIDVTRNIINASKRRWQAGAWWLKWRATRGVSKVELTGKDGQPLTGQLTPESAEAIRERILFGEAPRKQLSAGGGAGGMREIGRDELPAAEVEIVADDDADDVR